MLPPRGYLFIFLNAVRLLSIIGLLLVFASNVVVLADDIKAVNRFAAQGSNNLMSNSTNGTSVACGMEYIPSSTVPNQPAGVFWAVVNRLLIIFQVVALVLSEMNWPQVFFNSYFPVLGNDFGLGPLGIFECLIGAAVLSHHVETFAMVSAFFVFSVGCLNILLGLIFREKGRYKRSLTSWKDSSRSVLPKVSPDVRPVFTSPPPTFVSNLYKNNSPTQDANRMSDLEEKTKTMGFGRQLESNGFGAKGEKAAGLKGFLITRPLETLPRYAPKPTGTDGAAPSSRSSSPTFHSSPSAV
ncbi:hypothetical protein JB92DRAFT_3235598 [Gautieria morchelliformis]|nr:hypothetical protein JB92DRAFT_3235598 [Gautieria morchelliformis]